MSHQTPVTRMTLLLHGLCQSSFWAFLVSLIPSFIFWVDFHTYILYKILFVLLCALVCMIPAAIAPLVGFIKLKKQERITGSDFDIDMQDIRISRLITAPDHHFKNNLWICFLSGPFIAAINRRCFEDIYAQDIIGTYRNHSSTSSINIVGKMRGGKIMQFHVSPVNQRFNDVSAFLNPRT